VTHLDCDHCGGHAITSRDNTFGEGDSDRCDDCGFPGTVVVYDSDEDEPTAQWSCSDDPLDRCKRADCAECAEVRAAGGKGEETER
jgi:hypothetical protein